MTHYRPLTVRLLAVGHARRSRRVQSPPMSNRSRREAESRAEARRRARYAAQGFEGDSDASDDAPESTPKRTAAQGSFLQRLFPPAPPLKGKTDPLADFQYAGPLRGVVATLYLLGRKPMVWIAMGVVFGVSYLATLVYAQQPIGVVASIVSFVALIAAGWIGWQRPWAYGLAAAVLGYLLFVVFLLLSLARIPAQGDKFVAATFVQYHLITGTLQAVIGVVAGFYGGYLRRRMAEPRPGSAPRRRR
jgi:hypothetical protein